MSTLDEVKAFFRTLTKFGEPDADYIIYHGDGKALVESGLSTILLSGKSELLDPEWVDGAKYSVHLGKEICVQDHYWKFETVKSVMEEVGFTELMKIGPYLKDEALKLKGVITEEVWNKYETLEVEYTIRAKHQRFV